MPAVPDSDPHLPTRSCGDPSSAPALEAIGEIIADTSDRLAGAFATLENVAETLRRRAEELGAREQELDRRARDLDARDQRLEHDNQALLALQVEIEQRQAEVSRAAQADADEREALRAELERREASLAEFRNALDATRIALEAREAELAAQHVRLRRGQEAVAKFQKIFNEMAATVGMPNAPTVPFDLPGATHEHGAPAPPPAPAEALDVEPAPAPPASIPPPSPDDLSFEMTATERDSPESAAEVAPKPDVQDTGPAPTAAAGSIDESALDPAELARLRVLRRLTGGTRTDAQLLERIRQERDQAEAQSPGRSKRRWWGGGERGG